VDSLPLLGKVEGPVGVEVAVAAEGAKLEDRLGADQAPAGAGAVHAVLDQVPAGALDHAGGDRPAGGEGGRVVQVGLLVEQVGRGGVGRLALGRVQVVAGGLAADRPSDDAGAAVQDRPGVVVDPGLGGRVTLGEEAVKSIWGAVSVSPPVRLPRPLPAPGVPLSRHRALHKSRRWS
jgi:hypothetical protein